MEDKTSPEALLLTAEPDLDALEIPIKEELVEEVMQELYRELFSEAPPNTAGGGSVGRTSAESCGASVSDSASSVMAGIEPVGPAGGGSDRFWWGCIDGHAVAVGSDRDDEKKMMMKMKMKKGLMDGCDGAGEEDPDDDEWLARVLNWGPVEVDSIPGF